MIKHLDTSTLIKYTSGNNKGHFNWKENIGKELPFQYDDLTGIIKIIDYKSINRNNLVTIKYQDNVITTSTSNLLQLKIPSFLNKNKNTRQYLYKIGDIIDKDFQESKVIEQTRISVKATKNYETTRGYKLKCLCCGYNYQTREDVISSCPVCGIRSSWTERFIFSITLYSRHNKSIKRCVGNVTYERIWRRIKKETMGWTSVESELFCSNCFRKHRRTNQKIYSKSEKKVR